MSIDPFRQVLDQALARMITTLCDAKSYIAEGKDLAAIGTLCTVENEFADLQAALRLFTNAMRKT